MKNSLSKNTFFYLIYNVLNIAFPFITSVYVARVLLPFDIGQVETAKNLANYFITFSLLGIPTYALRECSKLRNDKIGLSKLYSELLIINAISVALFLASYIGIVLAVDAYREHLLLFLITGSGIALNFLYVSWLYEGLEKFDFISIRNIIFKAICFVLLIVFVRGPNDVFAYAGLSIVGTAGNYIVNFVFARRYVKPTFKGLCFRKHLKSIFILAFTYFAIELYSMVDVTMLSWMRTKESVAFYSYAARIKSILLTVLNTFTIVIVPRLATLHKNEKKEEYKRLLEKVLDAIIFFSVPAIIGVWFVADYAMVAIYGAAYYNSSSVLKILSFVLLISPIGYLLGSRVCLTTGHEEKMIVPVALGAASNIILNAFLIRLYAENGAAIASVISEIIVLAAYLIATKKYYVVSLKWIELFKTILSSAVMFVFLLMTVVRPFYSGYIRFFIQIIGGFLIYACTSILINETTAISVLAKIKNLIRNRIKSH